MSPIAIPSVFYSYARADQTIFGIFLHGLRAYAAQNSVAIDDWFDEKIAKGNVWREEIATQIDARKAMIVLVTTNSVKSAEVEKEVRAALAKEKLVIPVQFEAGIALPQYLASYQAIRVFEYGTNMEALYARVIKTLQEPYGIKPQPSKYNLYVATLSKHGGRTSVVVALNQLMVDGYHFPGYFKPFQVRGEDRRDVEFVYEQFNLSELNLSTEQIAPFEYNASSPNCSAGDLRDAFERASRNRHPVMIEGTVFKPKNMTLHEMVVDVLDARLLLIIDHKELENLQEPPTETLQRIASDMNEVPVAFLFNRVPPSGLSDTAREVRQVALELRFREVGEIPFDERLSAIAIGDIVKRTNGQLLVDVTGDNASILEDLIWRHGFTNFTDQDALNYYQTQKANGQHEGRAVFSTLSKLGLNIHLLRLGYTLFLVGTESPTSIDPALTQIAQEQKKAVIFFQGSADEALEKVERAKLGIPFCYKTKLGYLKQATAKLEKSMLEVVIKRPQE